MLKNKKYSPGNLLTSICWSELLSLNNSLAWTSVDGNPSKTNSRFERYNLDIVSFINLRKRYYHDH